MYILGLNAYHGDSAACLLANGKLVAAAEEERFRRVKHWAGFPTEAIRYCLKAGGITIDQLDHIAINRKPNAHLLKKALFSFSRRPGLNAIMDRLTNVARVNDIKAVLGAEFAISSKELKAPVHQVEHHLAHMASSFLVSPFDSATLVSIDGFGDFVSTMWGEGKGGEMEVRDRVNFPHSLGLFYLAVTQHLGFWDYGDEYKVMGLAPYGKPTEMERMRKIVRLKPKGLFELELDYFLHHSQGVEMVWANGAPSIEPVWSGEMGKLLGPARKPGEPLSEHHKNVAASLQEMYEEAFFHLLDHAYGETRHPNLCLAGGCAMNSVANGKIFDRTGFRELYIQSAAGDAGGAIGAAFSVWHHELGNPRSFTMEHAYLGPRFSDAEVNGELSRRAAELKEQGCEIALIGDEAELCSRSAAAIADNKVVGWFQGRMEWGPRALGNRSIVCDPRSGKMKDILNTKIKRRESFRPFAPSIVREAVGEWFETDYAVPFMQQVYRIRPDKQARIPAVTHVDGSGRLQTVTEAHNPRYYRLIRAFETLTGVPLLVNTSFNENEPVICTPKEALDCFLRTKMDILVLNNFFVERR